VKRTWIAMAVAAGSVLLMGADDSTDAILDAAAEAVTESKGPTPVEIAAKPEGEYPKHQGILQLGPREWKITTSLRDHYIGDFKRLQTLAKPTAHRNAAGEVDGYFMRLPRYGLAHQAGLRNGDVVHAINGYSLGSWTSVLALYRDLKHSDELIVQLTRRNGKKLKLVYHIK
jgi:hypothetical protein